MPSSAPTMNLLGDAAGAMSAARSALRATYSLAGRLDLARYGVQSRGLRRGPCRQEPLMRERCVSALRCEFSGRAVAALGLVRRHQLLRIGLPPPEPSMCATLQASGTRQRLGRLRPWTRSRRSPRRRGAGSSARSPGRRPAQTAGWPAIATGGHVLIQAPTGSGKTLAAFLYGIDRLDRDARRGPAPPLRLAAEGAQLRRRAEPARAARRDQVRPPRRRPHRRHAPEGAARAASRSRRTS